MKIAEIDPYVRFARIHQKEIYFTDIVAFDHRAFYCAEGEGVIEAGGKVHLMKKGSLLLIRAGVPYKGVSNDQMTLYAVNFDMKTDDCRPSQPLPYVLLADFNEEKLAEPRDHWYDMPIGDVLYLSEFYPKENFALIISEFLSGRPFCRERCSLLLKDILIMAAREVYFDRPLHQSDAILAYVREHYSEKLTNEDVAVHFSYHKNYINAILKKDVGQTLHAYLLHYRISIAVSLLSSGEYSVFEVAERVGFEDPAHFSRAFKKIIGKTPFACLPKKQGAIPTEKVLS